MNTSFAAPGDHHVSVAKLYEPTGVTDGVRTRRASGGYSVVRALGVLLLSRVALGDGERKGVEIRTNLETVLHGDVPGSKIDKEPGNEKGTQFLDALRFP